MLIKLRHWRMQWDALKQWERRLLPLLVWRLFSLRVSLHLTGLQTLVDAIDKGCSNKLPRHIPVGVSALELAQRCEHLVLIAVFHGVYLPTCLPRALALYQLLAEFGLPARLKLGVQSTGGTFAAHAWVECHGVMYFNQDPVYLPFPDFGNAGAP